MNALYARVERDELLFPLFPGGVPEEHRVHVIAWRSEVFGGPARYTEELGGFRSAFMATRRGNAGCAAQLAAGADVAAHAPVPRWARGGAARTRHKGGGA